MRQHRKLEKQKKLAKAERLRRLEETHLQNLHDRLENEWNRPAAGQSRPVDVARLQQSVRYQERLQRDMSVQEQMVARARETEDRRREELLVAAKQEKIFVKLKERQQERYLIELDHREQKETDEIATNLFLHK